MKIRYDMDIEECTHFQTSKFYEAFQYNSTYFNMIPMLMYFRFSELPTQLYEQNYYLLLD